MKKIVTIQDISCYGKCSLTVALPLLSAMGLETVILPTAILSTHTMFSGFTCLSLDPELPKIQKHWEDLQLSFDAIYTGYLATKEQIDFVKNFFRSFSESDRHPLRFVDPAMADNGKLYVGFPEDFPKAMAGLCGEADIIVPNLTEAALMTGQPYREDYDEAYIRDILTRLLSLGTKQAVVLTGVSLSEQQTGVYGLLRSGEFFHFQHKRLSRSYHGTGDIFSSVTVGGLENGLSLPDALALAADFTKDCIQETMQHDPEKTYGVNFEPVIPTLVDKLRGIR